MMFSYQLAGFLHFQCQLTKKKKKRKEKEDFEEDFEQSLPG